MKVGDLVRHKLSGVGVIIDVDADYKVARDRLAVHRLLNIDHRIMYANGSLFWTDSRLLEVISESR